MLVLEHGDDGAIGIVLNRDSAVTVADVFPEWNELVAPPEAVFVGGPVSTEAVIALARRRHAGIDGFVEVLDDLGTIDLADDPLDIGASLQSLRVFSGYSGWSAGQLEDELEQGAWFVVNLEPTDPFVDTPERLWRDVLRRQRGRIALFANWPEDATVN